MLIKDLKQISHIFKTSPRKLFVRILLFIILIFSLIRLFGYTIKFGQESLQMDFSIYYTAGQALNQGLSPYKNYLVQDPNLWDGLTTFQHSSFLYPLPAALPFQFLALFPYSVAKYLWMLVTIFSLLAGMIIVFRLLELKTSWELFLFVGIIIALFHPLLTILERGQIDAVTFAIIILAVSCLVRGKNKIWSGIFLAIATVFKLHVGFVVPFLFLRHQQEALVGYVIGAFLIVLLSLGLYGPDLSLDYLVNQLPRISRFGAFGTEEMKLPEELIKKYLIKEGDQVVLTTKGSYWYIPEAFGFLAKATAVSVASFILSAAGIKISISVLSLLILAGFITLMWWWQYHYHQGALEITPYQDFIYWQIVLIVILLAGPITWVMNTIWLLPITLIVVKEHSLLLDRRRAVYSALAMIGLLGVALPDHFTFSLLFPYGEKLLWGKYVAAEVLLFISLLGLLTPGKGQEDNFLFKSGLLRLNIAKKNF